MEENLNLEEFSVFPQQHSSRKLQRSTSLDTDIFPSIHRGSITINTAEPDNQSPFVTKFED